jgi:hypothetical protein
MIEFSQYKITRVNDVIEARNKLYRLARDLKFQRGQAIQLSVSVSEVLRALLHELAQVDMR